MIIAVLFGGPLDGDRYPMKEFTTRIVFPVKREIRYAKEGELPPPYSEEIYDLVMPLGKYEALYIYRQK